MQYEDQERPEFCEIQPKESHEKVRQKRCCEAHSRLHPEVGVNFLVDSAENSRRLLATSRIREQRLKLYGHETQLEEDEKSVNKNERDIFHQAGQALGHRRKEGLQVDLANQLAELWRFLDTSFGKQLSLEMLEPGLVTRSSGGDMRGVICHDRDKFV